VFGFSTKLPITDEDRLWVDDGFLRLVRMLGRERMLNAEVVLPEERFFSDVYDGSKASVIAMAARIAAYLGVPEGAFSIEIFAEDEEAWRQTIPERSEKTKDAAGLYFHEPEAGRHIVGVHAKHLKDPLLLAATIAHELVHVLLLGGGLLDREAEDMEPITDLATVFLGFGVFTSQASFQFKQWTEGNMQGWSVQKIGYLPERILGYALARFAHERGENKPPWARALPTNIRDYCATSAKWLRREHAKGS
jgi:hypothetical protein